MEYKGQDPGAPIGPIYGTVHYGTECSINEQNGGNTTADNTDWINSYHIFSVEWFKNNTLVWFVDSKVRDLELLLVFH